MILKKKVKIYFYEMNSKPILKNEFDIQNITSNKQKNKKIRAGSMSQLSRHGASKQEA